MCFLYVAVKLGAGHYKGLNERTVLSAAPLFMFCQHQGFMKQKSWQDP